MSYVDSVAPDQTVSVQSDMRFTLSAILWNWPHGLIMQQWSSQVSQSLSGAILFAYVGRGLCSWHVTNISMKCKCIIYNRHGGPGSGMSSRNRTWFDPSVYRIIMMDQRGAGKSLPSGELKVDTPTHIDDLWPLKVIHIFFYLYITLSGQRSTLNSRRMAAVFVLSI